MQEITNRVELAPTVGLFHRHDEVDVPLVVDSEDTGVLDENPQGATYWVDVAGRCPQCQGRPTEGVMTMQVSVAVKVDVDAGGQIAYVARSVARPEAP